LPRFMISGLLNTALGRSSSLLKNGVLLQL
jgi:hypothetical protein